ncbi:hypothetical protein PRUPE_4G081300 [Prunus persica]|uniref:Uncharacterized protein n=1 Tax=Prunus persica TaxID=3760 RepID=M5WN22_PRUPE|nr:hypothetical protein PRUPE_4G081300 [Prunus persica]
MHQVILVTMHVGFFSSSKEQLRCVACKEGTGRGHGLDKAKLFWVQFQSLPFISIKRRKKKKREMLLLPLVLLVESFCRTLVGLKLDSR